MMVAQMIGSSMSSRLMARTDLRAEKIHAIGVFNLRVLVIHSSVY